MDWEAYRRRIENSTFSDKLQAILKINLRLLEYHDALMTQKPFTDKPVPEENWRKRREEGKPILDILHVPPDPTFTDYCEKLMAWVKSQGEHDESPPGRQELFRFVYWHAWRPLYQYYSRLLTPVLEQSGIPWPYGYCPVCGIEADLSAARDDQFRLLYCPTCASQWDFPALKCPFCGNQEENALGCLAAEEFPAIRVEFCQACRGYIKSFDLKKLPAEFSWEMEDLLSLPLDYQAQQKGFHRGSGTRFLRKENMGRWEGGR